jgi:uncharacterized protein involved in exopolysaccharide biosynthesis
MENEKSARYNFSSVDLLIYIWKKRWILGSVGLVAGIASIIISFLITPMFQSSVIMFPASGASVSRELLNATMGRQSVYGFGEEEQAEQLLQVLHSEPIRTRIIEKYNLMEHYEIDPDSKYPMTELKKAYNNNINFRLTEFMSVEISVMDKDPVISAAIANDISALVDTVFNTMKRKRALKALEMVGPYYDEAQEVLGYMQDSLGRISNAMADDIPNTGNGANNLLKAFAEFGVDYMYMLNQMRHEVGMVANMRYRYNEAKMEAQSGLSYKFVVEEAFPPEKKAYPNKSLIVIISTFASLLFALIVLIVIDNIQARMAAIREE